MTQERNVVGAIRPGRYLTRGGQEVYVACRCNHNPDGARNAYPWWVEDGRRGWSIDAAGRHLKNGASQFDIVSRPVSRLEPERKEGQTMDLKQHLIRQMAFSQATAAVEIHKALFAAKKVKV